MKNLSDEELLELYKNALADTYNTTMSDQILDIIKVELDSRGLTYA